VSIDKDQSINKQERIEALTELKEMLAMVPENLRSKPLFTSSMKTFTPEQIIKEAEENTEDGTLILKSLIAIRRKFKREKI
jgi:hypothetical protein